MAEFVTPDFLEHHSVEEVYSRIKSILPPDLDLSEGGHGWNLTIGPALVASELCEFVLPEVIKLIFPEWSYGIYLDGHARSRRMTRRPAAAASGELTISGAVGTVIQAGSLFSTASVNDEPSVDYKVLKSTKIPDSGTVTVDVQCTQAGIIGNTQPNTIVLVSSKITGITSVTNMETVGGGTEEETDESLIQRIMDYDQSQGDSFTGSVADYKRWAMSVPGVGSVTVIPAQDDTGLVTIIITDANGDPATEQLCTAVYNYIMKPDDPDNRFPNVNANLKVEPPATMAIGITATVELVEGATIESVKAAYMAQLALYLPEALDAKEIKYTRVHAALAAVEGANDFSGLRFGVKNGDTITYGTSNIAITSNQLPTIAAEDLVLTSGTV